FCCFVLWTHTSKDSINTELASDSIRYCFRIPGDHHNFSAEPVECFYRVIGFWSDFIGEFQTADHDAITHNMQNDGTICPPCVSLVYFWLLSFVQQMGPANAYFVTIHHRGDSNSW